MRLSRQLHVPGALVVALGALLFLPGCNQPGQTSAKAPPSDHPGDGPVRYAKVIQQTLSETLDLAAKVQPDPTKVVRIFPPVSGRVVAIEVKPGDCVRRGRAVATLSSSDIASARSDFAKANIEAERATRAMQRQKVLFEHGAAAEKDYIDARAQADAARAELARATQRLELLRACNKTLFTIRKGGPTGPGATGNMRVADQPTLIRVLLSLLSMTPGRA